jgi:hypothetical protein
LFRRTKMKYLVPLAKGEVIGRFVCLWEAEVMQLLKTTAIDKGSLFVKRKQNWLQMKYCINYLVI